MSTTDLITVLLGSAIVVTIACLALVYRNR
jgi:hypothetical protein